MGGGGVHSITIQPHGALATGLRTATEGRPTCMQSKNVSWCNTVLAAATKHQCQVPQPG